MPDKKTALDILVHNCAVQDQYTELRSHSVVRNFVDYLPKRELRSFAGVEQISTQPFVKDELESTWDGTIYTVKHAKPKITKSS